MRLSFRLGELQELQPEHDKRREKDWEHLKEERGRGTYNKKPFKQAAFNKSAKVHQMQQ